MKILRSSPDAIDHSETPPHSHEAFAAFFAKYPLKRLAASLHLSPNTLGTWAHPSLGESQNRYNPLDRLLILTRVTGDRMLCDWLCGQLDGYFVANICGSAAECSLHRASAHVTERFAGILACIATAVADDAVSDQEADEIRGRWEAVKSLVETFVVCCQQRNFDGVADAVKTGAV